MCGYYAIAYALSQSQDGETPEQFLNLFNNDSDKLKLNDVFVIMYIKKYIEQY